MANQVSRQQLPERERPRRWPFAVAAGAVLLVAYGAALLWFSTQLGDDIESRLHQVPVVEDTHHRAD